MVRWFAGSLVRWCGGASAPQRTTTQAHQTAGSQKYPVRFHAWPPEATGSAGGAAEGLGLRRCDRDRALPREGPVQRL